jgi:adenylate kinase
VTGAATRRNGARPRRASEEQAGPALRIYVMLGAPGAGKGTQAERLAQRLGIPHIASGDLFRTALREKTPLGLEARRYMDRGSLVPDDVTIRMIAERLRDLPADTAALLDGFPRTLPQAQALDALLERWGGRVVSALYIDVDQDELVRRMAGRRICRASDQHVYHVVFNPPLVEGFCDLDGEPLYQREDDEPATVRARLSKQLPPMFEVVDHYTDRGALCAVSGNGEIETITDELLRVVAEPAC